MLKTLVIHPKDSSTDYLSEIYLGKKWTILSRMVSKEILVEQIKAHDRIVMLGHGSDEGLYGFGRFVINDEWIYLLKEKLCVCIWCYANKFVETHGLKGFYTGMIISEIEEADAFDVQATENEIENSNILFAQMVKSFLDDINIVIQMRLYYNDDNNEAISFNRNNLYYAALYSE